MKGTKFAGFVEPNDGKVSVCVQKEGKLIGAWRIHSGGVSKIALNGKGCMDFAKDVIDSYKSKDIDWVAANPPPRPPMNK